LHDEQLKAVQHPEIHCCCVLFYLFLLSQSSQFLRFTSSKKSISEMQSPQSRVAGSWILAFQINTNSPIHSIYVAFSTGGLWKTTDNGLTYKPVSDEIEDNAIGDVAVSHSNPDVVWIGNGNDSYYGMGVYKSVDGGETWKHMGLEKSYYVTRIRIHPENQNIFYVAATGYRGSNDPQRGVFKTTKGGKTWKKSLKVKDGDDQEVWIDPDNSKYMLLGYDMDFPY